jgi:hypothetical protein
MRKTVPNPIEPNVILMSATITPSKDRPGSTRMDPAIRMNDCVEALRYYEGVTPEVVDRIVFLENSDTDLTPLKNALQRKSYVNVEFISISSDYRPSRGKGYGEFRMFDEGLLASELIRADDHIWKVTGRLKILNIKQLICSAPAGYEVYCDLREVPLIGESLGAISGWNRERLHSVAMPTTGIFAVSFPKIICAWKEILSNHERGIGKAE